MSKILLSGSIAYDRIMVFPGYFREHFAPDKLHALSVGFQVDRVDEQLGGTAGNVAYNLTLLGENPSIIGTAGSDFARYEKRLLELGIDVNSIHTRSDDFTATAYVITDKGDNQISAFHPGAGGIAYGEVDMQGVEIVLSGPSCIADMESIPAQCRVAGIRYLFDPGQQTVALSADALRKSIEGASVLFGNDYEFGMIEEKTGWDEAALLERAHALVITLGGAGARIVTKEGEESVAAVQVEKTVDPTGAGDAHRAGFIKGLLAGLSPVQSARIANVVASYAVETYGTQSHSFTMGDLANRYRTTYGESMPGLS